MKGLTVYLPIYNEVKYIRSCLDSLIDEGCLIIISDNASTDGTSEICQDYARQYPNIKYYRQKENIGVSNNGDFCLRKVKTDYTCPVCGHHIFEKGSIRSMFTLMQKTPDASHVYAKNLKLIDSNSHFVGMCSHEECSAVLESDNLFVRLEALSNIVATGSVYYGIYKTRELQEYVNSFQPDFVTDVGLMSWCALHGKLVSDANATLNFRWPNKDGNKIMGRRMKNPDYLGQAVNPYYYDFCVICDRYAIAKEAEKRNDAPTNYASDFLARIVKRNFWAKGQKFILDLDSTRKIAPQRRSVAGEVYTAIHDYQKSFIKRRLMAFAKFLALRLLPYQLVLNLKIRFGD
jgi:glycosyltransferase involved in cell wall biosynthesis